MFEVIYAFVLGNDLFVASFTFFLLLTGPFLCLFMVYIADALKDGDSSPKISAPDHRK